MKRVIVERTFPEPVDVADLMSSMQGMRACYDALRVRHLRTCVSLDGRRMICEYEAPDAESVRQVSQRAGLPFDSVWTAQVLTSGDESAS